MKHISYMGYIWNPVRLRWIQNNARNRRSIENQIRKYADPSAIALVSCSKAKAFDQSTRAIAARSAYCSPLFDKSKAWAQNRDLQWGILSAKYGILPPVQEIQDYDLTINELTSKQKEAWRDNVREQLSSSNTRIKKVYVLAGKAYVDAINPVLEELDIEIEEPLKGKQIGERLSVLKNDMQFWRLNDGE